MNRTVATRMIAETARLSDATQFILITPQSLSHVSGVHVVKLGDPGRNQGEQRYRIQAPFEHPGTDPFISQALWLTVKLHKASISSLSVVVFCLCLLSRCNVTLCCAFVSSSISICSEFERRAPFWMIKWSPAPSTKVEFGLRPPLLAVQRPQSFLEPLAARVTLLG